MHELSLAIALVEVASDAAHSLGASRVSRLFVRLGPGAGVAAEALRFSLDRSHTTSSPGLSRSR
jgi:Zn finger protein HypA/HybF involved in hydrogenase expression